MDVKRTHPEYARQSPAFRAAEMRRAKMDQKKIF